MTNYKRVVLAARPEKEVQARHFRVEEMPMPEIGEGQVLVRNHYLSLDPYMRGRMNEGESYVAPQELNETMGGGTVGEVIASRHARFEVGDKVQGMLSWTEVAVSDGKGLQRIPEAPVPVPLSAYLGVLGMPGMTAWYGLNHVMAPKKGDTIVVSAASGAVGSVVGQLAKHHGCRAVGIAGGEEKCRYVVEELGFDACVDYKAGNLVEDLKKATPDGVDALFENVGGGVFDATLSRMNPFGRIALCGMIASYDGQSIPQYNISRILTMRLTMRGFIVGEHLELWPQGLAELTTRLAAGELKFRESLAHGIDAAPEAFIGLLKGKNFGKQLVKLI